MCLERTIELEGAQLAVRDWPGIGGPLVHAPDPLSASSFVEVLAARLAPTSRVLSVAPRRDVPYQVTATDLASLLRQFDFSAPVLVGERSGCVTVLLVAAWYPELVGRVVLVELGASPTGNSFEARALHDCPPDVTSLRGAISCDVLEVAADDPALVQRVEAFLAAPLP